MYTPTLSLPRYLARVSAIAPSLGISPKTARNWISAGKFPIRTFRLGGARVVRIADVEAFVAQLGREICPSLSEPPASPSMPTPPKRRRGRPRKGSEVCS